MTKFLVTILGISLLVNVLLGFMYAGQRTIVSEASEIHKQSEAAVAQLKSKAKQNEKSLRDYKEHSAMYEMEHSEDIKRFVKDTFTTLFTYDNKTYTSRFDRVKNRLADSVISKLQASGEMESPQIDFSNTVKSLEVYLTALDPEKVKALVNMETEYSVNGSKFPRKNQMYEVTVVQEKKVWVIDKLELMGAFEPFEEN
ncbi:hypothetical protein M1K46_19580 [Fictibacillus sp. WQ 8-8]|uniref:hypothetical protein n=1 Tax=Fictibacillus sp. WQ 8-8 TaxID=2938788 RepID=UPI00210B2233|nr:hypothetical protein [Fictibacillus sp. WQ 8-8]MCQ6267832.1 hypothetical protein [Fictibacillus sp. WQ 8-8]